MIKHLTLVLMLFATAFVVYGQTPPSLDHFNCYFTSGTVQPVTVQLLDQFSPATAPGTRVADIRMVRFCNPVQKGLLI